MRTVYQAKINSNTNRKSRKKNLRFEHELIIKIEADLTENESFSSWVKQACNERLLRDSQTKLDSLNDVQIFIQKLLLKGYTTAQVANVLNRVGISNPRNPKWSKEAVELQARTISI